MPRLGLTLLPTMSPHLMRRSEEGAMAAIDPAVALRGRDAELEVVDRRLDEQSRGRGGVILIRGAAGLGKSALLARAELMARERGSTICHGEAAPTRRAIPLAPLLDAVTGDEDRLSSDESWRRLAGSTDQR
jgi:predicted ATPase